MYIVGIDIGKRHHEATIIDSQGAVLGKPLRFANSYIGFCELLGLVQRTAGQEETVFGMEATGHYWMALYTHLRREGYTVHVLNPVQSDALRSMSIRQARSNSRDSFVIAEAIRFGRLLKTTIERPDLHALRELCRHRFEIADCISGLKSKIIALLDEVLPEYESLFADTFGKPPSRLLSEYTMPEEPPAVDTDKLAETISAVICGRQDLEKGQEIQDTARNSFGILLASDSTALLIFQYIEQIRFVEKQVDAIDAEIARLFAAFDNQLTTIPGIGPTLAAVILSEIGDIRRFSSPAKLAVFAGIVKQSEDFTGTCVRTSKQGSPYLHRAVWQAAAIASVKAPAISLYYQRKRSEGKSHLAALGHVSRKLIDIVFGVLRDNTPYIPDMPNI